MTGLKAISMTARPSASTLRTVRSQFADLLQEDQAALMLVTVKGMNYEEAANALDISREVLIQRLTRGRLVLMDRLRRAEPSENALKPPSVAARLNWSSPAIRNAETIVYPVAVPQKA